ncbi:MAG: zinc ribbon domain-containing protein [Ruminococcus sp.]|nr:zinc ribbon domain-containing protein [Ruminococcus sp.]
MSKFCTTCGTPLDDNATFCTNCGTPQGSSAPNAAPQQGAMNMGAPAGGTPATQAAAAMKDKLANIDMSGFKTALSKENLKNPLKNKYTIITLSVIGVLVITLIVILLVILLGGGYKKPVDKLCKALETGEGKYYVEAMTKAQAEYYEEAYDIEDSKKYDSLEEYYDEKISKKTEKLEDEYGDKISVSFSVEDKEELTESRLKSIKKTFKDTYDTKVDVTDGYSLLLSMTWKGSDDEEDGAAYVDVVKVDGDWVVYGCDYNDLVPSKLGGGADAGADAAKIAEASRKAKDKLGDIDDLDDLDDLDEDDIKDLLGL